MSNESDTLKDGSPAGATLVTAKSTGPIPRRRSSVASLKEIVNANRKALQSEHGQEQAKHHRRVVDECTKWRDSHYTGTNLRQTQMYFSQFCATLAKIDHPWDYGIRDGSLFKVRPEHPELDPTKVIQQLGEYLSCWEGHDTLPTREQAVKDTEASGSKFYVLALAFYYADEDRRIELEKKRKESRDSVDGK